VDLEEYRKLAEVEDRMWYFEALNRRFTNALDRASVPAKARVLDAGCGTGGLIRFLRQQRPGWEMTGLDFMPLACELARERTRAEIVQGSIMELPFENESFDAIISADVVCQVEDDRQALREFSRCVRPGGLVVVNVPAYRWLWSYHDDTCHTKHRYTRAELVDKFGSEGFQVTLATYANLLPLPLIAARRKIFPPANPTSDVRLYPKPIELAFAGMAAVERAWISWGLTLPLGSSVFIVARRS
jgi:SAM-dependent methyltransferase